MPSASFTRVAAAAALAFVTACDGAERIAPSAANAALDFGNAPAQSGQHVFRGPGGFVTIIDAVAGQVLTAGLEVPPATYCAGPTPGEFSPSSEQDILSPTGALHVLAQGRDVKVVVYGGIPNNLCDLGSVPIVATGSARFISHENNVLNGGPGADSYGSRVFGTVTLADGSQARLQAFIRSLYGPDGEFIRGTTGIRLSPISGRR